jgi:predicted DNA-binding transcriptional regulator YafY
MDGENRRARLLRLLRRRSASTVKALAQELGASRRTVLRDLGRLRAQGYDIDGEGGPGGGVRLDPSSVLPDAQLRADEVVSLIVAVAVARAMPTVPFSSGAEIALARIERALPAERVREMRRLLARILIGAPFEGAYEAPGPIDPRLLASFEKAFNDGTVLAFAYVDKVGRSTSRSVEPHGILLRMPYWYVIAWDRDKDAARLFRMDRIRAPRATHETFTPRPQALVTGVCPDAVPSARHSPR